MTAKSDYAVRAMLEIAAAGGTPVKGEAVAASQQIPPAYLESILSEMRQSGLLNSRRGPEGGYWLARPPAEISVADIVRAVDGPLALVRGDRPETVVYAQPATPLTEVWVAVRASLRAVLEVVDLAAILDGKLPRGVAQMLDDPGADRRR